MTFSTVSEERVHDPFPLRGRLGWGLLLPWFTIVSKFLLGNGYVVCATFTLGFEQEGFNELKSAK
jgi:hypothetical protein